MHVTMRNPSTLGIVIRPAPVAPLRELLVALLAGAVALRQLDWWKLLSRAGHLPTRRRQILVHVAAIGLTFTGTDASEEVAEDEESPLRSAMGHALVRVALATLPELHRAALTLRYFEAMDYAAIERALDLSNGALRGILGRAMETMRKRLRPALATLE
jgi:hypothetical protein